MSLAHGNTMPQKTRVAEIYFLSQNEFRFCYARGVVLRCCCRCVRMRWNDNNGRITQIDELYRRSHSLHASIVLRVSFCEEKHYF